MIPKLIENNQFKHYIVAVNANIDCTIQDKSHWEPSPLAPEIKIPGKFTTLPLAKFLIQLEQKSNEIQEQNAWKGAHLFTLFGLMFEQINRTDSNIDEFKKIFEKARKYDQNIAVKTQDRVFNKCYEMTRT